MVSEVMAGPTEHLVARSDYETLRDERDRLRANLVNCVARLEAYYGEDYPAVRDAKAALDAERAEIAKVRATCDMLGKERNEADEAKHHAELQLSQLQALVSGMKSIIPHQHCRTCNQYADELRNYDIWGKRTLDATTPAPKGGDGE